MIRRILELFKKKEEKVLSIKTAGYALEPRDACAIACQRAWRENKPVNLDIKGILIRVNPGDYRRYVLPENGAPGGFFCDVCSHFDSQNVVCTLGYKPIHTIAEQSAKYDRTGHIALCRAIEID